MISYSKAEELRLVESGNDFFEVLERMIDESTEVLHLQTYIFECDATGQSIINALCRAAARNVEVYVLVDAIGSFPFPGKFRQKMEEAGIRFRLFSSPFSSENIFFCRRLHHKIVVADRKAALVGGINIADKYHGNGEEPRWLDYAVLIRGNVCLYLHTLCEQLYQKEDRDRRELRKMEVEPADHGANLVRFRRNDWLLRKNEIHESYRDALLTAHKSVTLLASYFLPGRTLRRLLKEASQRGVTINIILAGKSDVVSIRWAERYLYDFYIRYKIRVYEWGRSVMHAKVMMVDDRWATIGSYNINRLSQYLSIELNAEIKDPDFLGKLKQHVDHIMNNHCRFIPPGELEKKAWYTQFKLWLAYNFYRILGKLFTSNQPYREKR